MRNIFVFPGIAALIVVVVPVTLITIAARSPYTHANLAPGFDPGYARTMQTLVGPPLLYSAPNVAEPLAATTPIEDRGKAVFAARGCAGCHGMDGQGGVVGPKLILDIEVLRDNVRSGPGGMPVFAPQEVTDYDLTAIVAYLKSVSK